MSLIESVIAATILRATPSAEGATEKAPTAEEVEKRLEGKARQGSSFSQEDWDGEADWLAKYWNDAGYQGLNRFLQISSDPRTDWEVEPAVLQKLLALEEGAKGRGTSYHIDTDLVQKLLHREEISSGDVRFNCHASDDPRYQSCEVAKQGDSERPPIIGAIEVLKSRFDLLVEQAKPFGSERLPVRNIDPLAYRLPLPEGAARPKAKEDRLQLEAAKRSLKEGFSQMPTFTEIYKAVSLSDLTGYAKRLRGWLAEAEKIALVPRNGEDRRLANQETELFKRLDAVIEQTRYLHKLEGFNGEERLADLAKRVLNYAGQEERRSSEQETLAGEIKVFLGDVQELKAYRTEHQIQTAAPFDLDSLQRRLFTLSITLANISLTEAE